MGLIITPDSAIGRENWRWEHTQAESITVGNVTVRGERAVGYQPYPSMFYLVTQKNPWAYEHAVAHDEAEARNLQSRGFVAGGLQAACDAYDAEQQEHALLAAARNYEDRNMSERARAEADAAEQASARHLPAIPETPKRKYVRKAVPTP